MVEATQTQMPRIVPMIAYEDAGAAIDWLQRAFGFREVQRITEKHGTISHAELEFGDGRIFLATPTRDYQSPRHYRQSAPPRGRGPRFRG